ncbi:MAG: hypothetical protein JWO59_3334 [Chloroflexi bacterium]|nr:hypothetical protein [Chloroflexota bacterium]
MTLRNWPDLTNLHGLVWATYNCGPMQPVSHERTCGAGTNGKHIQVHLEPTVAPTTTHIVLLTPPPRPAKACRTGLPLP